MQAVANAVAAHPAGAERRRRSGVRLGHRPGLMSGRPLSCALAARRCRCPRSSRRRRCSSVVVEAAALRPRRERLHHPARGPQATQPPRHRHPTGAPQLLLPAAWWCGSALCSSRSPPERTHPLAAAAGPGERKAPGAAVVVRRRPLRGGAPRPQVLPVDPLVVSPAHSLVGGVPVAVEVPLLVLERRKRLWKNRKRRIGGGDERT